jgi:hypothetical protein
MDLRPGVGVVVGSGRVEPLQLERLHARPTRDIQPLGTCQ